MKKIIALVFGLLLLSSFTVAYELTNIKAYKIGSSDRIDVEMLIRDAPIGSILIEPVCIHEGIEVALNSGLVAVTSDKEYVKISTYTKECGRNDLVKVGLYEVIVGYKGTSKKKIVIVPPTPEELIEQSFKECKLDALNWFNEHKEHNRMAGFVYGMKVAKCEYDKDKSLCELKEGYEWKKGRCVKEFKK